MATMSKYLTKNTLINKQIDELVDKFWINLGDMFDLVHELIEMCYDIKLDGRDLSQLSKSEREELNHINPNIIFLAKMVIINCTYSIADVDATGNKIEPEPSNNTEWKYKFIEKFIKKTYNYWDLINAKDESFFLDHAAELFTHFDSDQVNAFKMLFQNDDHGEAYIEDDDKLALWKFFTRLIQQGMEIIHLMRNPKVKNGKKMYGKKYIPDIKLKMYSQIWKMSLKYYQE